MADPTTEQLNAWLTEARAARHKLVTGSAVASVQYEGKGQVTYNKAEIGKLDSYIASLESQLSAANGTPTTRLRPIHFTF